MKKMNIAIVGLGNIGSYLYKYLETNKKILSKKNNCIPNIIFVSAKNRNKKDRHLCACGYVLSGRKDWGTFEHP